jgi:hypothetical protein
MAMPRRTIHISESTEELVRELAGEDESFSAAVTRLIEAGAAATKGRRPPGYVGIASGPPDELGRRAEEYLREAFERK